ESMCMGQLVPRVRIPPSPPQPLQHPLQLSPGHRQRLPVATSSVARDRLQEGPEELLLRLRSEHACHLDVATGRTLDDRVGYARDAVTVRQRRELGRFDALGSDPRVGESETESRDHCLGAIWASRRHEGAQAYVGVDLAYFLQGTFDRRPGA